MEILNVNGQLTMTSIAIVEYINDERGDGVAQLAHSDFLKKVHQVLGEKDAGNFSSIYLDSMNREKPCYNFPKREACLMVMSYSYDIQAKIFDRWQELEVKNAKPLPNFANPAEAARAWAIEYEARIFAENTKAEIGNRREATAMNTASQAVKKAHKLEIELDKSKQYSTVKRMQLLHHGQRFDWRMLKQAAADMDVPTIDVFDQNYGSVKAYHADVWKEVYAISIDGL